MTVTRNLRLLQQTRLECRWIQRSQAKLLRPAWFMFCFKGAVTFEKTGAQAVLEVECLFSSKFESNLIPTYSCSLVATSILTALQHSSLVASTLQIFLASVTVNTTVSLMWRIQVKCN